MCWVKHKFMGRMEGLRETRKEDQCGSREHENDDEVVCLCCFVCAVCGAENLIWMAQVEQDLMGYRRRKRS